MHRITQESSSRLSIFYFSLIIVLGNYLMVNMTLVILKSKFTNVSAKSGKAENQKLINTEEVTTFSLQDLRNKKLWVRARANALFWVEAKPTRKRQSRSIFTKTFNHIYEIPNLKPREEHHGSFLNVKLVQESLKRNNNPKLRRASTRALGRLATLSLIQNERQTKGIKALLMEIVNLLFCKGKKRQNYVGSLFLKVKVDHGTPYESTSESEVLIEG